MKINHNGLDRYDELMAALGDKIDEYWPELRNLCIDAYDTAHPKDFITETANSINATIDEIMGDPYQCYPAHQINDGSYVNDIIQNDNVLVRLGLTDEEKEALIAHEIGHFVSCYKNTGLKNVQEEIYADSCAALLGLAEPLKIALQKCINSGLFNTVAEMQQRIAVL